MPTLTKKQIVFPAKLFTLIQKKVQKFGISVEAYLQYLAIQDLRTKPKTELNSRVTKKAELKKWQAEFEAKLAKLPIRKATPAEERAIAQGIAEINAGKCKKMTAAEIIAEATA